MLEKVNKPRCAGDILVDGELLDIRVGADFNLKNRVDGYTIFNGCKAVFAEFDIDYPELADYFKNRYTKNTFNYEKILANKRIGIK